jgi:hypothetical protein
VHQVVGESVIQISLERPESPKKPLGEGLTASFKHLWTGTPAQGGGKTRLDPTRSQRPKARTAQAEEKVRADARRIR